MKKALLLVMLIALVGGILAGCGEKVDTNIEKVNEGKGERIEVQPRNRDGEAGGR